MADRYPIPGGRATAELTVSKSRFIATASRANTVAEAKGFVRLVRSEHPKANHHVYAFVVGYGASVTEGCGDDGEPSGTAGRPTLALLRGSGMGDTALVITRYFGGIKLGTGGLVHAYGEAARQVLEALPRAEKVEKRLLRVTTSYSFYELLHRLVATHRGVVLTEDLGAQITLDLEFIADDAAPFAASVLEMTAGRAAVSDA